MRSILSILAGVSVGILAVFLIEMINLSLFPLPQDLDVSDSKSMTDYVNSLPISAFVMIIIAHSIGAFVSSFIAGMVSRSKRVRIGIVAGLILLCFTISNALNVEQPLSITLVDIILAALAGVYGAKVGASRVVG